MRLSHPLQVLQAVLGVLRDEGPACEADIAEALRKRHTPLDDEILSCALSQLKTRGEAERSMPKNGGRILWQLAGPAKAAPPPRPSAPPKARAAAAPARKPSHEQAILAVLGDATRPLSCDEILHEAEIAIAKSSAYVVLSSLCRRGEIRRFGSNANRTFEISLGRPEREDRPPAGAPDPQLEPLFPRKDAGGELAAIRARIEAARQAYIRSCCDARVLQAFDEALKSAEGKR